MTLREQAACSGQVTAEQGLLATSHLDPEKPVGQMHVIVLSCDRMQLPPLLQGAGTDRHGSCNMQLLYLYGPSSLFRSRTGDTPQIEQAQ